MFLPGESQGRGSLVGCRLWGRTESNTTEVMQQQQQQQQESTCLPSWKSTWLGEVSVQSKVYVAVICLTGVHLATWESV